MKKEDSELIEKAIIFSSNIKEALPQRADAASLSFKTIVPFKALSLMMLLEHRVSDLSEVAIDLYRQGKVISAFVITRALMETVALLFWLHKKVNTATKNWDEADVNTFLERALLGSRDSTTGFKALNILTAVNQVDKKHIGYRKRFDTLCEFCHPNWLGTQVSYGKPDQKRLWLDLGKNISQTPLSSGLEPLVVALEIFCNAYDALADLLPVFNQVCEENLG